MNQQKSQALNITLSRHVLSQLQPLFSFKLPTHALTYLAIKLTLHPSSLFQVYYPGMLAHLTSLMSRWSSLQVSWLGHITVVKITLFLKILYLFRVLPATVPPHYLHILQHQIITYIWGSAKPQPPKSVLMRCKLQGSLGLPNFIKYYPVAKLAHLAQYHIVKDSSFWISLAAADSNPPVVNNLL